MYIVAIGMIFGTLAIFITLIRQGSFSFFDASNTGTSMSAKNILLRTMVITFCSAFVLRPVFRSYKIIELKYQDVSIIHSLRNIAHVCPSNSSIS